MFSAQRASGRYIEADKTIDEYIQFLKENKNTEKINYAFTLKAMLSVMTYKPSGNLNINYLIDRIDAYIKSIKENGNVQTSKGEALLVKLKLHYLTNNKKEVNKLILNKDVKEELKKMNIEDIYLFFIEGKTDMKELKKVIQKRLNQAKVAVEMYELKWILNQIQ
jgi:hypothetical protein